jgi:vacuolar-type H+-ATPase subunit I/STV1
MEAHEQTQGGDNGKLVALAGKLKDLPLEDVLRQVYTHLLSENEFKRDRIEELADRLQKMEDQLLKEQKEKEDTEHILKDELRKQEGTKQLINKLLEDIRRYQNDIEWYKRTYETRSFFGTIKEKLFKHTK